MLEISGNPLALAGGYFMLKDEINWRWADPINHPEDLIITECFGVCVTEDGVKHEFKSHEEREEFYRCQQAHDAEERNRCDQSVVVESERVGLE
jgi:hypothetical protein